MWMHCEAQLTTYQLLRELLVVFQSGRAFVGDTLSRCHCCENGGEIRSFASWLVYRSRDPRWVPPSRLKAVSDVGRRVEGDGGDHLLARWWSHPLCASETDPPPTSMAVPASSTSAMLGHCCELVPEKATSIQYTSTCRATIHHPETVEKSIDISCLAVFYHTNCDASYQTLLRLRRVSFSPTSTPTLS